VSAAETYAEPTATTIYCPGCGQAMKVAPQHMQIAVNCPSCQKRIKPWRILAAERQAAPASPPQTPRTDGYSMRNRWVAGTLGVLLGPFGVHRFYMGFIGIGILQALITVLSLGILAPLVAVWAFIEGILCFCGVMRDVDGRLLNG
jgi:TM2 domain-containing membrane protein YozV